MGCSKLTLTNTGTTVVTFNYQECDSSEWEYQVELSPNETKNIWFITDTFSCAVSSQIIIAQTAFPPTPTPSKTPSVTPTPTVTPTPSTTPYYKIDGIGVYYYAADDSSTISGITGNIFANGVMMTKEGHVESNKQVAFTGGTISYLGTGSTFTLILSASPVGDYYLASDGVSGLYNKQILSAFTYTQTITNTDFFTGVTRFYSGDTLLPYSENGEISINRVNHLIYITGDYDTGYFNILPNP